MMNEPALMLGAVAYDPKVVTIWDGFQTVFRATRTAIRLRPVHELRAPGRSSVRRAHPCGVEFAAGMAAGRAHRRERRDAARRRSHA